MTPQQLIGVAVRLFAIWLALLSIGFFISLPSALNGLQGSRPSAVIASYAIGGVYLLAALALWTFPMVVAHRLLPRTAHTNVLWFRAHELARVGCALLGLWMLSRSLPAVVALLFRSFALSGDRSMFSTMLQDAQIDIAVSVFNCAFAVLIIMRSRSFASLIVPKEEPSATVDVNQQ
jgi:nitric oxide reductase large subunit